MNETAQLNPLTMARIDGPDSARVLYLRAFAPGRSLIETAIEQKLEPELYDQLLRRLETGADTPFSGLDREQFLRLWSNGLLVSASERSIFPPTARPGFDPMQQASALVPEIAPLFAAQFVPQDPGPAAAESFRRTGVAVLPCLFSAVELEIVRRYFLYLRDGNWLKPDRHQTCQKIVQNDPVSRHVQDGLVPLVTKLVGRTVKPSFSYATEYHGEAPLPRHTDRAQCEYTMSLFVDFDPQPGSDMCPWPLIVHHADGDQEYRQTRGGSLLFKGRVLEHSRPPLPPGARAMLFFLCFVHEDFTGPLN